VLVPPVRVKPDAQRDQLFQFFLLQRLSNTPKFIDNL
jgi:hypothetical protein